MIEGLSNKFKLLTFIIYLEILFFCFYVRDDAAVVGQEFLWIIDPNYYRKNIINKAKSQYVKNPIASVNLPEIGNALTRVLQI